MDQDLTLKNMIDDPLGSKLLGVVGHSMQYAKDRDFYPYIRKPQFEGVEGDNLVFEVELIYKDSDVEFEVDKYLSQSADVKKKLDVLMAKVKADGYDVTTQQLLDRIYDRSYKIGMPPRIYKNIVIQDEDQAKASREDIIVISFTDQIINDIRLYAGKESIFLDSSSLFSASQMSLERFLQEDLPTSPQNSSDSRFINLNKNPLVDASIRHILKYGIDTIIDNSPVYPGSGDVEALGLTKKNFLRISDEIGNSLGLKSMRKFLKSDTMPQYWGKDWRASKKAKPSNKADYWQENVQFVDYVKDKHADVLKKAVADMFLDYHNDEVILGSMTVEDRSISKSGAAPFRYTSDVTGALATIGSLKLYYESNPKFGEFYKNSDSARLAIEILSQYDPEMLDTVTSTLKRDAKLTDLAEFMNILRSSFEYEHDKTKEEKDMPLYKSVFFTVLVKSDTTQGLYKFFLESGRFVPNNKSHLNADFSARKKNREETNDHILFNSRFSHIRDFLLNLNIEGAFGAPVSWNVQNRPITDKFGNVKLNHLTGEPLIKEIPFISFGYADIEDYTIYPDKIMGKRVNTQVAKSLPAPQNYDEVLSRLVPNSKTHWLTQSSTKKCPVCKGTKFVDNPNGKQYDDLGCGECEQTGVVASNAIPRMPGLIDPFFMKEFDKKDSKSLDDLQRFADQGLQVQGFKWGSLYKQQFGELPKTPYILPTGENVQITQQEEPFLSYNLQTSFAARDLMTHIGKAISDRIGEPYFIVFVDNSGSILLSKPKKEDYTDSDYKDLQDLDLVKARGSMDKRIAPIYDPDYKDKAHSRQQSGLVLNISQSLYKIDTYKSQIWSSGKAKKYVDVAKSLAALIDLKTTVYDISTQLSDVAIEQFKKSSDSVSSNKYSIYHDLLSFYAEDDVININKIFYFESNGEFVMPLGERRAIRFNKMVYQAYLDLAARESFNLEDF